MRSRPIPLILGATLAIVTIALGGCAAGMGMGAVSPDEIPALQRLTAEEPQNAAAWTRLGVAYGKADRPADARQALERAVELPATPVAAWAHLGISRARPKPTVATWRRAMGRRPDRWKRGSRW